MSTGSEVLCSLIPSQRRGGGGGGGQGNLLRSRFMWLFSLRNFQDFLIHLFHNPVLRPGFPLFFSAWTTWGITARTTLCPPLAWDDLWPSYLRLLKVIQPLLPPKLLWWRSRHPRLRWWRQGRFPRSRPRLRPPHPCIRTAQWLLMTFLLLLLLRRSPTRCFWQESHGSYHLFPSVQHSLVLRSLLVRRWRRRRLDPDFPRPSQGTRTSPGLSSLRPLVLGFACPYLHPATFLLLHPGCGPDGAPPLTWPWSVVHRRLRFRQVLLAFLDLQAFQQDLQL